MGARRIDAAEVEEFIDDRREYLQVRAVDYDGAWHVVLVLDSGYTAVANDLRDVMVQHFADRVREVFGV